MRNGGDLVLDHPGLYLRERWPVFRWVIAPPDLLVCHPDVVGVDGPPDLLKQLGLTAHIRPQDRFLYFYVAHFFHTPDPLPSSVRGDGAPVPDRCWHGGAAPADIAVAGLEAAALIFALSFFVVSIACDYRYLYFLDLAAMTGVLQFLCGTANPLAEPDSVRPPPPSGVTGSHWFRLPQRAQVTFPQPGALAFRRDRLAGERSRNPAMPSALKQWIISYPSGV